MPRQVTTNTKKRREESSEAGGSGATKKVKTHAVPAEFVQPSSPNVPNGARLSIEGGDNNPHTSTPEVDRSKVERAKDQAPSTGSSSAETKKLSHSNPRKLVPPRPFPTVPTSVSETGPRSAHTEGKNFICVTRKTPLGSYLRRCKDIILKDGYKTLYLYALGAAIPHLARLAVSLPSILPFALDEIHTEVRTGTAELQDEIIPDDEDEAISIRKRGKSTMSVMIRIGDGKNETRERAGSSKRKGKREVHGRKRNGPEGNNVGQAQPEELVFQEGDLDDDDMDT